jgi:hypothetical protein
VRGRGAHPYKYPIRSGGYPISSARERCAVSLLGWSDTICNGVPEQGGTRHVADGTTPGGDDDGGPDG